MSEKTKYEYHEAADAFPMMDNKRHAELVEDIRQHGLKVPIVLCQGKILDGRNRWKACQELGLTPKTSEYYGNPWSYVWSMNGQRRDLSADQRAQIWLHIDEQAKAYEDTKRRNKEEADEAQRQRVLKRAEQKQARENIESKPEKHNTGATSCGTGVSSLLAPEPRKPRKAHAAPESAAKASNTNRGAIERAQTLATHRPDLADKVRSGEMKPAAAHRQMKQEKRKEQLREMSWPEGKYRVIYADPPWAYNNSGMPSSAASQYETMDLAALKKLDVESLALPEAVLFMWTTAPQLADSIELVRAWGFEYKTNWVWDKGQGLTGFYANRVRHEHLLVAVRGSCRPEETSEYVDSIIAEPRLRHSEKPAAFRELIDRLYPTGPRIELFARKAVDGWEAWGNEVAA
jgi:N6-adenosine-specific RNA methylase IME4